MNNMLWSSCFVYHFEQKNVLKDLFCLKKNDVTWIKNNLQNRRWLTYKSNLKTFGIMLALFFLSLFFSKLFFDFTLFCFNEKLEFSLKDYLFFWFLCTKYDNQRQRTKKMLMGMFNSSFLFNVDFLYVFFN